MLKLLLKRLLNWNRFKRSRLANPLKACEHTEEDKMFMERALELARHAAKKGEVPVGAVLVKQGKIIGEGFNQPITQSDPSAHAEILALRDAGQQLKNYRLIDTTLYVTLEPCPMCAGSLIHARIDRLVFGAFDPKTGACGSQFNLPQHSSHNHRVLIEGGLLEKEASQLISSFFKRRRAEKRLEKQKRV